MSFANTTPPAVLKEKATAPNNKIYNVFRLRKWAASIVAPTAMPRKMVTMSIKAPPAVLRKRSVTPHSRSRFPNISIPIRGALDGMARDATTPVKIGKIMTAVRETGIVCGISTARSFLVVNIRMMGG